MFMAPSGLNGKDYINGLHSELQQVESVMYGDVTIQANESACFPLDKNSVAAMQW